MGQWWLRLLQTLGVIHSASHTLDITRLAYQTDHFIMAYDLEKAPVANGTGFNMAKGELLTLSMRGLSNTHQRALVMCHSDSILELKDTGCDLLTLSNPV